LPQKDALYLQHCTPSKKVQVQQPFGQSNSQNCEPHSD
jgi:hypothetical protein